MMRPMPKPLPPIDEDQLELALQSIRGAHQTPVDARTPQQQELVQMATRAYELAAKAQRASVRYRGEGVAVLISGVGRVCAAPTREEAIAQIPARYQGLPYSLMHQHDELASPTEDPADDAIPITSCTIVG